MRQTSYWKKAKNAVLEKRNGFKVKAVKETTPENPAINMLNRI
jgi:hypothetical protein